jgi:hypothetical protein
MKTLLIAVAALSMLGCTNAGRIINGDLTAYDDNTKYRVDEAEGGFKLSVVYEKYQFVKDRDEMADEGMAKLNRIAAEIAAKSGKQIKPLDKDFVKIGTGRQGLSGTTSWAGIARVEFKD